MSTLPPAPHVVVYGSINIDLVVRTPRFARAGETLIGSSFSTISGGKGVNQAVACARLGANVRMVGRVGQDPFGDTLLEGLRAQGVNVEAVVRMPGSSGLAVIEVEDLGENHIVVIPGANAAVGAEDLERLEAALEEAALLLQLEVPLSSVLQAARRAHGGAAMLDPAPAQHLPPELYALCHLITPNASEAASLVGFALESETDVFKAGRELLSKGVREVLIKRGALGVTWMNAAGTRTLPALKVQAVDTVAAGDAFNGGLAAALAQGLPLEQALVWGSAAGALSVTKLGAQSSLPSRAEVLELLAMSFQPSAIGN